MLRRVLVPPVTSPHALLESLRASAQPPRLGVAVVSASGVARVVTMREVPQRLASPSEETP